MRRSKAPASVRSYVVTDLAGNVIRPGDRIIGARGDATFESVVYGPEYTGTARIRVNGYEYRPEVWGLTVVVAGKDGVRCQL